MQMSVYVITLECIRRLCISAHVIEQLVHEIAIETTIVAGDV